MTDDDKRDPRRPRCMKSTCLSREARGLDNIQLWAVAVKTPPRPQTVGPNGNARPRQEVFIARQESTLMNHSNAVLVRRSSIRAMIPPLTNDGHPTTRPSS